MRLLESIASYTGASRMRIQSILTKEVKEIIYNILVDPNYSNQVNKELLDELIEMDIFQYFKGKIIPNTAIFLKEDIDKINDSVNLFSEDLAKIITKEGSELLACSANVRNFIGCIVAMGQGLHKVLKETNKTVNWPNKTGKYERSKVDFNEDCPSYRKYGEDYQIKRLHQGKQFTSVIIGQGTNDYCSYLWNACDNKNKKANLYYQELVNYLTDAIPLYITGKAADVSLQEILRTVNIDPNDQSIVVTLQDKEKYQDVIERISYATSNYYFSIINDIKDLLSHTVAGKLGTSYEVMMMNLWRYMRKAISSKLYEVGFLTDNIPTNGNITVFYENGLDYFK